MKNAATAANCTLRNVVTTHVLFWVQKDDQHSRALSSSCPDLPPLQEIHQEECKQPSATRPVPFSISFGRRSPANTSEFSIFGCPSPSFVLPLPFCWQHFLNRAVRSRHHVLDPVVKVSTEEHNDAQESSWVIMAESHDVISETPRLKKRETYFVKNTERLAHMFRRLRHWCRRLPLCKQTSSRSNVLRKKMEAVPSLGAKF